MTEDPSDIRLFDSPGYYQIRVVGMFDQCWLDQINVLEIKVEPWGGYQQVTQICGWFSDQTVLSGLLDLVTNLSMVILSVERIDNSANPCCQDPANGRQISL